VDDIRTDKGEENGEKDQAVHRSKHHDSHVHAEVEHLEELRVRERKHENATELCQCYPAQYLHDSMTTQHNNGVLKI